MTLELALHLGLQELEQLGAVGDVLVGHLALQRGQQGLGGLDAHVGADEGQLEVVPGLGVDAAAAHGSDDLGQLGPGLGQPVAQPGAGRRLVDLVGLGDVAAGLGVDGLCRTGVGDGRRLVGGRDGITGGLLPAGLGDDVLDRGRLVGQVGLHDGPHALVGGLAHLGRDPRGVGRWLEAVDGPTTPGPGADEGQHDADHDGQQEHHDEDLHGRGSLGPRAAADNRPPRPAGPPQSAPGPDPRAGRDTGPPSLG